MMDGWTDGVFDDDDSMTVVFDGWEGRGGEERELLRRSKKKMGRSLVGGLIYVDEKSTVKRCRATRPPTFSDSISFFWFIKGRRSWMCVVSGVDGRSSLYPLQLVAVEHGRDSGRQDDGRLFFTKRGTKKIS